MQQDLISWKTDSGKTLDMVAWYHQRMLENRGTRRLVNQVEVDLCARFTVGPNLLDVGIGSGRGSLPLARAGMQVTGIDSSQAMLDQTGKLAAETATPVRLLQRDLADLNDLKFADGEFDTVMSLNVLVHFPNWRDILAEWRRVTRPGGRILFDIHSQDHEDAACAARNLPPRPDDSGADFAAYQSRLRAAELVETADRLGLRIANVTPYAGIFVGENLNLWLYNTLADGLRYDRILSWLISDQRFYSFALFLEQEVFAQLTTRVTGRVMVALDNTPDAVGNATWLERGTRLNAAMTEHIGASLMPLLPAFNAAWCERFNTHLEHPRNRVLLHFLISAWRDFPGRLDLASFLDPHHAITLDAWRSQDELDRLAARIPLALGEMPQVAEILRHNDVPLAGALDYELTRDLLRKTFHAFD